jgi:arabinose-5-phosphate isomerase
MTVGNVMRKNDLPIVASDCGATEMIHRMTRGGLGLIVVVDNGQILGIVTDGDLRRAMESLQAKFFDINVMDIATRSPKSISVNAKLIEAEKMMTQHKVNSLLVTDDEGELCGVIQIYDIKL